MVICALPLLVEGEERAPYSSHLNLILNLGGGSGERLGEGMRGLLG